MSYGEIAATDLNSSVSLWPSLELGLSTNVQPGAQSVVGLGLIVESGVGTGVSVLAVVTGVFMAGIGDPLGAGPVPTPIR